MAAYEIINETYAETDVTEVDFTSIPGTYAHLKLTMSARTTSSSSNHYDSMKVTFNGDESNWYIFQFYGSSSSVGAGTDVSAGSSMYAPLATSQWYTRDYTYGVADILIPDYTSTDKYKSLAFWTHNPQWQTLAANTTSYMNMGGAMSGTGSLKSAAITSINLDPYTGGHIVRGSTFTLYGLKSS